MFQTKLSLRTTLVKFQCANKSFELCIVTYIKNTENPRRCAAQWDFNNIHSKHCIEQCAEEHRAHLRTLLLGKSLGKLNLVLLITSPVWKQRHAPQFRPPNNKSCLDTTPRAAGIYGNDSFFNCFVALINACALGRFLGA